MYRDDLVSQIRANARLRGRNEAGRALAAVLAELYPLLPDAVARELAGQMPAGLPPPPVGMPAGMRAGGGDLVPRVAARLIIDEPDAAFLCRVVFAQLNAAPVGLTPAALAHLVPAGLRPLVTARRDDPARLSRQVLTHFTGAHQAFLRPAQPAENSPGVVSIRSRAVRPVSEKVDRTG